MFDRWITYHAERQPSAVAVATSLGKITFSALDQRITDAAALLQQHFPELPDCIAIDIRDTCLHWIMVLALARLGVATTGADERYKSWITDQREVAIARAGLLVSTGWLHLSETPLRLMRVRSDSGGLGRVLLSSGTTGVRKRVALSWGTIEARLSVISFLLGSVPAGGWLTLFPEVSAFGFVLPLACWRLGRTAVFLDGDLTPDQLTSLHLSVLALIPARLEQLLAQLTERSVAIPSMHVVTTGGQMSAGLARKARAKLTSNLWNTYGTSESGTVSVTDMNSLEWSSGAVGHLLPGLEVSILDDQGKPTAAGCRGEICVKGERVASGYLNQVSGKSAFSDGYYCTGDIGRLDEEGRLVMDGRIDDLINLGGDKVSPSFVEQRLSIFPEIIECAAFALSRPGELDTCCVALVCKAEFDLDRFRNFVFKRLNVTGNISWMIVADIPRTAAGKVDRRALASIAERGQRIPSGTSKDGSRAS